LIDTYSNRLFYPDNQKSRLHNMKKDRGRCRDGVYWGGHACPPHFLQEVVPEIDANPVSFYSGGEEVGGRS